MTINVLFYNSYYRYGELRKQAKNFVNAGNLAEAKNVIDSAITEHKAKYPLELLEEKHDFNYGELLTMEDVKLHIDMVLVNGDTPYYDTNEDDTVKTLRSQLYKIVQILEHMPSNTDL